MDSRFRGRSDDKALPTTSIPLVDWTQRGVDSRLRESDNDNVWRQVSVKILKYALKAHW
ncbi:hypothetical protein EDC27_2234 [Desulfosoma caldarium]|uniref:Uncharacterized protein n=1 Tax=Desulfosoma caldarium TaxID=610254 RepID=A0A3N1ULK7_9BACT|nr:hypothetical protein EDC27_2234 [Desulfosoma caldarium]